ncbi:MAG: hypothetical protein AAF805_15305, partial [Planctomycetota bacterium]
MVGWCFEKAASRQPSRVAFRVMAVAASWLLSPVASAIDAPEFLQSYRVLPRFSELRESQSLHDFPPDRLYPVEGDFGFAWGLGYGLDWTGAPEVIQYGRFVEPDLRAPLGELLPAFLDIDSLFNLEDLEGQPLPLPFAAASFEVYRFTGLAADSAAASPLEQSLVELYAVRFNGWMYLRGETIPRSWFPNRSVYDLRVLARSGNWSDWNDDGVVDAADYTKIRDLGSVVAAPTTDGVAAAIAEWRGQFGEAVPGAELFESAIDTAIALQGANAVPEPASVILVVLAVKLGRGTRRS